MKDKIERFSLFSTAAISIIISVLDLSGLLERVPFLVGRTSALSLLVLGITVGYLAIERRSKLDKIEQLIIDSFKNTIFSLKGIPAILLEDSQQFYEYVARRMREAESSVDDLAWGPMVSTRRTGAQAQAFEKYKKARVATASKSHIQHREVMTFPSETDIGESRLKRAEQMAEKELHGHQLRYYDFPHKDMPPLPLLMVIDSREVILGHHRGTGSQRGETYLAIQHPEIVDWFQDYYNSIWQGAKVIKEAGQPADSELLQQLRQCFSMERT